MNLMITMLLGGLWHGASWNFVIWGGLHGVYLVVHKLILKGRKIQIEPIRSITFRDIIKITFTFVLVTLTWLFFRSTSWEATEMYFEKMVHWESSSNAYTFIRITTFYVLITLLIDCLEYKYAKHSFLLNIKSKAVLYGVLFAFLVVTLIYMFQADPLPFIYFLSPFPISL